MDQAWEMLERELAKELANVERGALSCTSWEQYVRTQGTLFAYTRVRDMMQDIVRTLNEPHQRR